MEENFFITKTLEIYVSNGCNLSCRACSHMSPLFRDNNYCDLDILTNDLEILNSFYRCSHIRILGGEPLLNPKLDEIISLIKSFSISSIIRISTNGMLVDKVNDNVWKNVNEVDVTIYSETFVDKSYLKTFFSKKNIRLKIIDKPQMRESFAFLGTDDTKLVSRIFNTCFVTHVWQCYNVFNKRFFRCPQSFYLSKLYPDLYNNSSLDLSTNRTEELISFLKQTSPLPVCKYCLGVAGKLFKHSIVSYRNWKNFQHFNTEELIDRNYLTILEHTLNKSRYCSDGLPNRKSRIRRN